MIVIQAILRFLISILDRITRKRPVNDKEVQELKDLITKVEQEKAKPIEEKSLDDEIKFWDKE
jgi:mannitol-1-phosphate/altronate dehydrogenase